MDSSPLIKSRALIIVMSDFHSRSNLSSRKGAKKDANRLFKVLSRLNYAVKLYYDKTAEEIKQIYEEESQHEQGDCFLSILSSHGEEGAIFDFHGQPIKLTQIFHMLSPDKCQALAGKPKLFFIQACRGEMLDEGIQVETDSTFPQEDSLSHYLSIPDDTTVMFASSPGYAAFLNLAGSVFLQTLCSLLEAEERHLELTRLLTRITYKVAYEFQARGQHHGMKEMPCFVTNMTRELYPFSR
ncbi:caspase-3-like isoform X2 [Rhinatrema bivittatum]|uniref:caspase-3-like isoform X2 n=1 Tax=Rhinatrema bivittatum TaxID=194408 RepID=UPI00112A4FA4|nr:caspase-3-like isoform X2 [Rhinatrema bivittatum]